MPPFRDEHILIIAPGSQTTLAQLGLPESLTPAKHRFPSRMYPGIDEGTWAFTKIREARDSEKDELLAQVKAKKDSSQLGPVEEEDEDADEDDEEGDEDEEDVKDEKIVSTTGEDGKLAPPARDSAAGSRSPGSQRPSQTPVPMDIDEEEGVYVEDENDSEGAVWPMKEGRIVEWNCFFALLEYIHTMINPTFHTPILLVHPPQFTDEDKERVTQFMFEKLKVPGFALLDSAIAGLWAYGLQTATVVDIGYEKTDVTPLVDFIIQSRARRSILVGGETMTRHLGSLLPEMKPEHVEALKKSEICEILPPGVPIPGRSESEAPLPAAIIPLPIPSLDNNDDDAVMSGESLDVAKIVMDENKLQNFVEKKPKEKGKKKQDAPAPEPERNRPNREKAENKFWVVDKKRPGEDDEEEPAPEVQQLAPNSTLTSPVTTEFPNIPAALPATQPDGQPAATTDPAAPAPAADVAAPADGAPADPTAQQPSLTSPVTANFPAQKPKSSHTQKIQKKAADLGITLKDDETLRQLTVGSERFLAADCGILTDIADAVFDSISAVDEVAKRADLWDSLIILGNGAKVKGFKEALLYTIISKYLVPPSSGTIFSSEIPSTMPTPSATGASTPIHPSSQQPSRPLLMTATSNLQQQHYQQLGQHMQHAGAHHSSHGQTPMSIKVAKMPEYFPEWKTVGFEEVGFLGAQVAAKVVFVVDQGINRAFMSRVEYNEQGPSGIHGVFL